MALTVSTRPDEYSNSAIFVTSTSLSEDSSHVNLRTEAELYVDGVVIAKKVKPKGIETFDFTDILRSKILFQNKPIDDGTAGTVERGKTGSNLITGWTQDGSYSFKTFTVSGADWTLLESPDPAAVAKCYTNSIALDENERYVIIYNNTGGLPDSFNIQTIPSTNGNVVNYGATTQKRAYFQPRTTGNMAIEVYVDVDRGVSWEGTWEMYKLNSSDWWCPYYVKFTEYYENSSGVTTAGASSTETTLFLFFKSDVATLSDYIISSVLTTWKFLEPDGYYNPSEARSYAQLRNPVSSTNTSAFVSFILGKTVLQTAQRYIRYNADGSVASTTDGSLADRYQPIMYMRHDETLFSTYPIVGRTMLRAAATVCCEEVKYYAITPCFPENIELIWENTTGGFSEYTFSYDIQKELRVDKEYYKDSNKKDRLIPDSVVKRNIIRASTPVGISNLQLEYIKEVLYSPLVYWMRGDDDLVRVTVKSEEILLKKDIELTPFQIEIEW